MEANVIKPTFEKKISNQSDFCFHIPILEILDKKSLYGWKFFIREKNHYWIFWKKKKKKLNHYWGGTVEELFAYIFGIYKKFGGNNPSILAPANSVSVAT